MRIEYGCPYDPRIYDARMRPQVFGQVLAVGSLAVAADNQRDQNQGERIDRERVHCGRREPVGVKIEKPLRRCSEESDGPTQGIGFLALRFPGHEEDDGERAAREHHRNDYVVNRGFHGVSCLVRV